MKKPRVLKSGSGVFVTIVLATLLTFSLLSIAQSAAVRSAHYQSTSKPLTPTAFSKPELVRRYQQTITKDALASRLYFLASDFFEGRETTARGQRMAAQYLASQYRLMGLMPKGNVKTNDPLSPEAYFQKFPVYKRAVRESHLEVMVNGNPLATSTFSIERQDGLSYFQTGNAEQASGGVVFAGYGIADDKLGYNDYAALHAKGVSIDGKWVLIFEDEPLADASTSLLVTPDRKPSVWSTQFINKRRALWNAGKARGLLIVKDASPRMQGAFSDAAALAALNGERGYSVRLSQTTPFPPTFAISTRLADQILSPSGHTVADLKREMSRTLKPAVFDLVSVTVNATAEPFKELETENVLAFIEGSDSKLKDEVIIVSSHYDHLGINPALKGDQIYNGAADDGSGVVASLELAEAFMRAKRDGLGPRRSILFINFTGEEKGFLGSSHYAMSEPVIPLEKTVADINMDGVGGIDPKHPNKSRNYIYINGDKNLSEELRDINKRIKAVMGSSIELTDGPGFSSDDRSFDLQLIPYIYYSTGLIDHYHTPGDEANLIDYDHLARVTQLIFGTVWQVANQDVRLRSTDRSKLTLVGYSCPPCPFECDSQIYDHPGECPVCGMTLAPKYSLKAGSGISASLR